MPPVPGLVGGRPAPGLVMPPVPGLVGVRPEPGLVMPPVPGLVGRLLTPVPRFVVLLGLVEYHRLAKCGGQAQGLIAAACVLAAFYFLRIDLVTAIVAALVVVELLTQLFAPRASDDLTDVLPTVSARLFGVLYVAVLGGYIIALRLVADDTNHLPAKLLTLFFIVVFAGDKCSQSTFTSPCSA